MKKINIVLSFLLTLLLLFSCISNKKNALYGKTYRDLSDIQEFSEYRMLRGDMLTSDEDEKELCFEHFCDANNNNIGVLEEIIERKTIQENWKICTYKLLDTINIGKIRDNEYLSIKTGEKDKIIIGVVSEDKDLNKTMYRAWQVNIKTEKLEKIKIVTW